MEERQRSDSVTPPSKRNRVLVTGATGLLGRAVRRAFADWDVIALGLSRSGGEVLRVDLLDEAAASKVVESFRPHVIVHCAAERRLDRCEKDPQSLRLNVGATRLLARLAKKHGAWLLFISTDYLFDGTKPPYREVRSFAHGAALR